MSRRAMRLLVTLALGLLMVPLAAEAQDRKNIPRLGVLAGGSSAAEAPRIRAFQHGLEAFGWVEGRNIVIAYRYADGHLARLPDLASGLVAQPVDVIVAHAPAAVRAAQQATRTIPIVMAHGGDPVAQGFVASLARPAGNVTGLSNFSAELSGKRLALLREAFPHRSRVAVIWNPDAPGAVLSFKELARAAEGLQVPLHAVPVRGPEDFAGAFQAASEHAGSLVVIQDVVTVTHRERIVELAALRRLPAIYMEAEWADAGGFMSYGVNQPDLHRRAAAFVDKILKGATPADLPVEQPTTFELVINLKTAEALGLTIPPTVLFQATEIIR